MLGAGIVHGLCIAALLPLLITVPASTRSEGGRALIDADVPPQAKADHGRSTQAQAKKEPAAAARPPELVTGSIVPAAATLANTIAKMPRERLGQAEPRRVTLASVKVPPANLMTDADPILLKANAAIARADPVAAEEITADDEPFDVMEAALAEEYVKAIDGEIVPQEPASVARAEPAASSPEPAQRRANAPVAKAPAAQPEPRARASAKVPAKTAGAAPKKRAAASVHRTAPATRRPAQVRVQKTQQPIGLGLFFRKPQAAARQPAQR